MVKTDKTGLLRSTHITPKKRYNDFSKSAMGHIDETIRGKALKTNKMNIQVNTRFKSQLSTIYPEKTFYESTLAEKPPLVKRDPIE